MNYIKLVTEAAYRDIIPDEQLDKMLDTLPNDETEMHSMVYQVVRKDYDFVECTWSNVEVVEETHSNISDALISVSALNKTTKDTSKFYVNQIEVKQ